MTAASRRPATGQASPDHGHQDRAGHLLAIVENIPFGIDTRLTKQVDALLQHG